MSDPVRFQPSQALEIATRFAAAGVEYLFLGKGGAILLGFPGLTQDVDVFPARNDENCRRLLTVVEAMGYRLDEGIRADILRGKDFVQLKAGPFPLDLVFAPDGIASFAAAQARRVVHEGFPVASLDDIIASKRASGREKDRIDLPLLEDFRDEYERLHPRTLKNAWEIDRH